MRFKLTSFGVDSYTLALNKRLKYVKEQFANEMKDELESISPKRTGKLASSYKISPNKDDNVQITNDCGYCRFVNDGTRFQAGQHFIEQAYVDTKSAMDRIINQSQNIS